MGTKKIKRQKKYTANELEELGKEFCEFCKKDHVFYLAQWPKHKKKTHAWWKYLKSSHPILLEYHEKAKEILAGKIKPMSSGERTCDEVKLGQGRVFQYTMAEAEELGKDLCEFCKKDHVFHIVQWTREQNETSEWWRSLRVSYPILKQYHDRAKEILGGKIVQLAFENGNPWSIQKFIPMYLEDVKEHLRDDMRAEATIKAEAVREAMTKDPDHPFWDSFEKFIEKKNERSSKQKAD